MVSLNHRTTQNRNRRITFSPIRGCRVPRHNPVPEAIFAFRRAIRAHRRLMKLAPDRFDHARVTHLAAERAQALEKQKQWDVALEKSYGADAVKKLPQDWMLPKSPTHSVQTRRAIEKYFAEWDFWLQIGRDALSRAERSHCTSRMSLTSICSLVDTAMTLGRLATGRETHWQPPPPELPGTLTFEQSLEKIYGKDEPDGHSPNETGAS